MTSWLSSVTWTGRRTSRTTIIPDLPSISLFSSSSPPPLPVPPLSSLPHFSLPFSLSPPPPRFFLSSSLSLLFLIIFLPVKGYIRKGHALLGLKDTVKARQAFQKALELDPNNAVSKHMITTWLSHDPHIVACAYHMSILWVLDNSWPTCVQDANAGVSKCISQDNPEERRKHAMHDPEVQKILGDPAMQIILQQMQSQPEALRE